MNYTKHIIYTFAIVIFSSIVVNAQQSITGALNPISTAVPFLTISPDARGGSIGDIGVASEPDAFSMHYNPAKYAYVASSLGLGLSYSPWLKGLVPDINMVYASGFARIDKNQVVAASIRYFNLGDIAFTDLNGQSLGNRSPHEFSIDATYSRMLTATLSGGVSARYIHSNLTLGQMVSGSNTKAGNAVAADVSVYQRIPVELSNTEGYLAWGINISNIGTKISYSDDNIEKNFLPTNLRFGPSLLLNVDDFNQVAFMVEINKLLVPTNAIMIGDSVISGMNPNVSVPVGMIHSFYDAPGGFKEELKEYNLSLGIEYWYAKQFALRGGFFYEDKTKGGRQFATVGAGFHYNVLGIDVSYIIPVANNTTAKTHPLANTMRFSLTFDMNTPK